MNRKYFNIAFATLAALLLLAACSQDEIMDDNALPEGMYPLEIASVSLTADPDEQPWGAKAPQTRVSESEDGKSSVWQTGDKIKVQIGNGTPGTYTYQGGGTLTVADGDRPAYWTSRDSDQPIKTWYTSSGGETVDLSDQTGGLKYIVTAQTTADFNESVSLSFSHALAKVRVYLKGTAYEGSNVTGITLSYPASCTVKNGKVTSSGTNGTIQMHKAENADYYEALVPPGTIGTSGNPFKVTINDATSPDINLSASLTLAAGSKHDVTLRVHQKGTTEVDLSKQNSVKTISDNGIYYFYNSGSYGIKVTSGSPHIYLDDAKIEVSKGNAIDITGGSPAIHVVGDNTVSTKDGAGIYIAQNRTVTITGHSREDKLTAKAGGDGAGIGSTGWYPNSNPSCGNISINNVTVYAYGAGNMDVSPGIGSGHDTCGKITIDNATVYARGTSQCNYGCPAIGSGPYSSTVPTIVISGSDIYAYRGAYNGTSFADWVGHGGERYSYQGGQIQYGSGSITSTTIYKGTWNGHSEGMEGTVVYDASGNATEQSQ